MTRKSNLKPMSERDLLRLYAELMEELRTRGLIRSSNNPVADYAEKVAVEYLGLRRAGKEARGYDGLDKNGMKYQIKGRRITRHNKSRQLGVIRNINEKLFHFLIAVIFDESFDLIEMWKMPYRFVNENATWSKHQNGHIFYAKPNVLVTGRGVEKIV